MLKKIIVSVGWVAIIGFSNMSIAATCSIDNQQMQEQIQFYGSISTAGCPLDYRGFGVTQVTVTGNGNTCLAECNYGDGMLSSQGHANKARFSTQCNWKVGDWGDTLTCSNLKK